MKMHCIESNSLILWTLFYFWVLQWERIVMDLCLGLFLPHVFLKNIFFPFQCFCFKAFLYSFTQGVPFSLLKYLCCLLYLLSFWNTCVLFIVLTLFLQCHVFTQTNICPQFSNPGCIWCTERGRGTWKRIIFNTMVALLFQCSHVVAIINK